MAVRVPNCVPNLGAAAHARLLVPKRLLQLLRLYASTHCPTALYEAGTNASTCTSARAAASALFFTCSLLPFQHVFPLPGRSCDFHHVLPESRQTAGGESTLEGPRD